MPSAADASASIRGAVQRVDWNTPFSRLALTHFASVAGDAVVAISLAGSLFFSADPSEGRDRVFLYLLITMAPFALVGPLIGPAMDRIKGGHRNVVVATSLIRAVCGIAMIGPIRSNGLALYPEALIMLVCAKSYQVAKAALVPSAVSTDDELVEANSKLQLISGIAGVLAGAPAGLLLLIGPDWVIGFGSVVFTAAAFLAMRMAPSVVAGDAPAAEEKSELRSAGVVLAATAMAVLRGIVGFVTFLMAFSLRGGGNAGPSGTLTGEIAGRRGAAFLTGTAPPPLPGPPPAWYFGVVVALSVLGGMLGAAVAPRIRQRLTEERMLLAALVLAAAAGIAGVAFGGVLQYGLLSFGVAISASSGKQAFDAVVQRDAPDANRGRSFARFESRFQMSWVIGALPAVLIPMPVAVGGIGVALAAAFGAVGYTVGRFPTLRLPRRPGSGGDPVDQARRYLASLPPFGLAAERTAVEVESAGAPGAHRRVVGSYDAGQGDTEPRAPGGWVEPN